VTPFAQFTFVEIEAKTLWPGENVALWSGFCFWHYRHRGGTRSRWL